MSPYFPEGAGISVDDRGAAVTFELEPSLYSEEVALQAAYWLSDRGHAHLKKNAAGKLVAELRCKDGQGGKALTELCGEFCNGLIDFALRARIASETRDIQAALLQRAFVELLPKSASEAARET